MEIPFVDAPRHIVHKGKLVDNPNKHMKIPDPRHSTDQLKHLAKQGAQLPLLTPIGREKLSHEESESYGTYKGAESLHGERERRYKIAVAKAEADRKKKDDKKP